MNKREQSNLSADGEDAPRALISADRIKDTKSLDSLFQADLGVDPLYAPILEAAYELRQNVEACTQDKIEAIKRETAEQTKEIYHKLTEAREEFKRLELTLQNTSDEALSLTQAKTELENQFAEACAQIQTLKHEIETQKNELAEINEKNNEEVNLLSLKHDALIEKLKNKIDQINQDYSQQLTNLQQKLSYQQQQMNGEITDLSEANENLQQELSQVKASQTDSSSLIEEIEKLKYETLSMQHTIKEKAEKLLRSDHSLKLANEEHERCQLYIKELENKNNSIQKELFENWITKKDEL